MRDLTDDEKRALHKGCIYCDGDGFYEGPHGGMAVNVYCEFCRAGFNITHSELPWQLIALPSTTFPPGLQLRGHITMPAFAIQLTRRMDEHLGRPPKDEQ